MMTNPASPQTNRRWTHIASTAKTLAFALAATLILTTLGSSIAAAQEEQRMTFTLSLKDPAQRTDKGSQALAKRLRARLNAARVLDYRVKVDSERAEVSVDITSKMGQGWIQNLLTAQGQVRVTPAAMEVKVLEDLRGALPEEVALGYGKVGKDADIFLYSTDRDQLDSATRTISLWDHTIYIAAPLTSDRIEGWRTWIVNKDALWMDQNGLGAVSIVAGTHPNYHHVTAYWELTPRAKDGTHLMGQAGLTMLTSKTRRLLLIIDGQLEHIIELNGAVDDGLLSIRMPKGNQREQYAQARRLAALLAAPAHPCEVVVLDAGIKE